jgi:hypothetical protein
MIGISDTVDLRPLTPLLAVVEYAVNEINFSTCYAEVA